MEMIGGFIGMILWIIGIAVWLWALIDILKSDFKDSIHKLLWFAVVFLLNLLGVALYYFIGREQRR